MVIWLLRLPACRLISPYQPPTRTRTPLYPTVESPSLIPTDPAATPVTPTPTPPPAAPDLDQALRAPFVDDKAEFSDATRYTLDLTLDVAQATVTGDQQISYTNTETIPLDAIYLRMFPNTPSYGGTMTVSHLVVGGRVAEPVTELGGSALRVPMAPALRPNYEVDLGLTFILDLPTDQHPADSRRPAGGYRQLGYYAGSIALANAYPMVAVQDDAEWSIEVPPSNGDAVFSEVAFYDVSITAPGTMTLAASGTCTSWQAGLHENPWSCVAPLMRDFKAVLREDYRVESRDVQWISVSSVFYTEDGEGSEQALDYSSEAVRLFNSRIGAYPFTELDVVETPTLAGGIEYPGLVVVNSRYYADGGIVMEWTVVHEVLHQWWYTLVGDDEVNEPWLDEALTQFGTLLYFEERYGDDIANDLLGGMFRRPYEGAQRAGSDKPAGLPVAAST